jgi:hypothetical protein
MKNCTKHSIERWVERIVDIKTKQERDEYIRDNSEIIKEHMNKTLEFAEFIYKGQIGDNVTRNYYIHNDIVFVLNTTDDAIITVYKSDFNFTPEINLQVSKGLIKEIHKLVAWKEELDFEVLEEAEKMKAESEGLMIQIQYTQEQLKLMQDKKKSIDEAVKQLDIKSRVVDLEIQKHTNHLVNSKEYREDLKTM